MTEEITLNIIFAENAEDPKTISISPDKKIDEMKQLIAKEGDDQDSNGNNLILIYNGKILANNQQISQYQIKSDSSIIVVKTDGDDKDDGGDANQPSADQSVPTLQMSAETMKMMYDNEIYSKMIKETLGDQNTIKMLQESAQLKPLIEANPEVKELFEFPEYIQQMFNPQALQEMSNALYQMAGQQPPGDGGKPENKDSEIPAEDEKKYKNELDQLADMGFNNKQVNYLVLKRNNGAIQPTIEKLLNMLQ